VRITGIFLFICIALSLISCSYADKTIEESAATFFSSDGLKSKNKIISIIEESSESLNICVPFIADDEITEAIISARSGFAAIEIVVDSRSLTLAATRKLINKGIDVHARAAEDLMSSFFIISDGTKLVTGSIDMSSPPEKQLCMVMVFNDKQLAANYAREFYILKTGQLPAAKDTEFDVKLGPMGKLYEPGWFASNQIFLDTGSVKGQWENITYSVSDSAVKFYFTPYRFTTPEFKGYTRNIYGTYSLSSILHSYNDIENGSAVSENRVDIINTIAPIIREAEVSIRVFASVLTEKIITDEILKAIDRGVKVELYLDYHLTLNLRENSLNTLRSFKDKADTMLLYKPDSGGTLSINLIQIDDSSYIISSAGFTLNSFINNDSSVVVIHNNPAINQEIKKIITGIKAHSRIYDPEYDYTGEFRICDYKENL
jgi:hypothetical protein